MTLLAYAAIGLSVLLLAESTVRMFYVLIAWRTGRPWRSPRPPRSDNLGIVILARDEAATLPTTLALLHPQLQPGDQVMVVADHCGDETASVAAQAGATVFARPEGEPGKGAALRWLCAQAAEQLRAYTALVVLDADSSFAPGSLAAIRARLQDGVAVWQTALQPALPNASPGALLAAYSEQLVQMFDAPARARLGWPVRLRGTGMVFQPDVLFATAQHLCTHVEDMELSWLCAAQGDPPHLLPEAVVFDPKPTGARGLSRQRGRWLQGQLAALRAHRRAVLRLLGTGPGGWALLHATLLRPLTLLIVAKLALVGSLAAGLGPAGVLAAAGLAFDGLYFASGLRRVATPGRYLQALLVAPVVYVGLWVSGGWLALRTWRRPRWLRGRP